MSQPRQSRPVPRITCPGCGLEQPVSMDCVGCLRGFSLEEINAAKEGRSPFATPDLPPLPPIPNAPSARPSRSAPPPTPPEDLFGGGPVFRDEPISSSTRAPVGAPHHEPSAATPTPPPNDSVFAAPKSYREEAAPPTQLSSVPAPFEDPDELTGFSEVYDPTATAHGPRESRFGIRYRTELSAGSLVQDAFGITFSTFLPVAVVTILVSIPSLLYTMYFLNRFELGAIQDAQMSRFLLHSGGLMVTSFLSQILAAAALTHVVGRRLRKESIVLGASIGLALRRLVILIPLFIVQTLGIFFGFLLLIFPGVILILGWSVAVPAVVIEGLGVSQANRRSWDLTTTYRGTIFLALLLLGILNFGVRWGVSLLVTGTKAVTIDIAIGTFFTAVYAVLMALIYFRLRAGDEGTPIEQVSMATR